MSAVGTAMNIGVLYGGKKAIGKIGKAAISFGDAAGSDFGGKAAAKFVTKKAGKAAIETGGKVVAKTAMEETAKKGIMSKIGGALKTGGKAVRDAAGTLWKNAKGAATNLGQSISSAAVAHPVAAAATAVAVGVVAANAVGSTVAKLIINSQTKEFKADAAKNDDNISRLKADIEFLQRLKRNADGDNQ